MEWWTAEMTDTVVRALIWVVTAALALWKGGAFAAAHEWAGTLKDARLATGANKLINWADAELSGKPGADKLNKVLTTDIARKLGIDRTDIEASLAARAAAGGKLNELTAALDSANARIAALEAQIADLSKPLVGIAAKAAGAAAEAKGFVDDIGSLRESFGLGGPDGGGGSQ